MKKITSLLALVILSLPLAGCLGDITEIFCETTPDSDHCFQTAAVQKADPKTCEKIEGKDFGYSNPPKDKCFLQIGENTGDPSVCDKIEGGMMSYTPEECLENVWKNHTPEDCVKAADEAACRAGWARHGKGCGEGYVFNEGAGTCDIPQASSSSPAGNDDDIESKVEGELKTLADAGKGKYMELLEKDIEGETDPDRLRGLQKYKEFLEKGGEAFEKVQSTVDQLRELKRLFLDSYDPSMNIENMKVDKLFEKGLTDRIKERLFGEEKLEGMAKENSEAEDSLTVYEAMLKRQSEIDFLKKGKLERVGETVTSKLKDEGASKVKEAAEDIAKAVAGDAFIAVGIVGDALQSFQDEAQKQMFVGLARAYNRRRDELAAQRPNASPEELHKATVAQVMEDPYRDNTNTGVIKHGNLLANKDCQDEENPLCIDNRAWWVAMDKAWQHNHK